MREREVKLAVDDRFEVPPLEESVPGAVPDQLDERTIDDVYHDTSDLRLLRWGATLRRRRGEGWTVKLAVGQRGGTLTRDEVTFPGSGSRPPAGALALVSSFTRGAPLAVVARSQTRRTAVVWRAADGAMALELADDRVRIRPASGPPVGFRQLEVELAPEAEPTLLDGVVDRLVGAGARPDPAGIKLARALGPAALEPPDVVVPEVGPDPTAADVIGAAIARSVRQLIVELAVVRLDQDIEGVHQARVATRRLRSDLRTFGSLVDPEWIAAVAPELSSLARQLGQVRDADVLSVRLRSTVAHHPGLDPDAGPRVVEMLEAERAGVAAALVGHLDRNATNQLLDQLVEAAADRPTAPWADGPAGELLPILVRRRWRRLHRAVQALGPEPPVEALHEVRILAKRTRYAAEAVAPAAGPKARAFARAIADIQEVLGELNDAATTEAWLTGAASRLDPAAAFAAGRLAEAAAAEALRHRHGWEAAYATAAGKRLRSWFS